MVYSNILYELKGWESLKLRIVRGWSSDKVLILMETFKTFEFHACFNNDLFCNEISIILTLISRIS